MKQGKSMITFVILALAAAIAVYLGYYISNAMDEPYRTEQVYAYTANDSVAAEGLVIRQAQVLPAQSGILEVTRAEGEKVGLGQQVALVYQDSQAQASQAMIEELQMEVQMLEGAVSQGGDLESAARLDKDILQAMVTLRASCAQGNYTQLREQVMEVKSSVLKRGYIYGEGLTAAELAARLGDLSAQLALLTQQSAQATTRVLAPVPGVFSNLVDGYESRLTPETIRDLTPTALQQLIDSPAGEDGGAMGKLITSETWYFAANLPKAAADRLTQGGSATLRFSGELDQDVKMTVERIGPTEEDVTLVVFSSNRYLTHTTMLRHQTAELIFQSWSGLRIPKEALRLEQGARQPATSGSGASSSGASGSGASSGAQPAARTGVYALVNGRAEFRAVTIATEGSDYYVVRPVGSGRKILRAGDDVIVHGTGLTDGLLIQG